MELTPEIIIKSAWYTCGITVAIVFVSLFITTIIPETLNTITKYAEKHRKNYDGIRENTTTHYEKHKKHGE